MNNSIINNWFSMFKQETFEEKYEKEKDKIIQYKEELLGHYEDLRDDDELTLTEFISNRFFNFYSYVVEIDQYYTLNMCKVLKAIVSRETFDYAEYDYWTFAIMCDKLDDLGWIEWGTSIRGCWLNEYTGYGKQIYLDDLIKKIPVCFASVVALIELADEELKTIYSKEED